MNEYDLIFDDDDAGEVADIVAIKNINDTKLIIDLFHCKYCPKSKRVEHLSLVPESMMYIKLLGKQKKC